MVETDGPWFKGVGNRDPAPVGKEEDATAVRDGCEVVDRRALLLDDRAVAVDGGIQDHVGESTVGRFCRRREGRHLATDVSDAAIVALEALDQEPP